MKKVLLLLICIISATCFYSCSNDDDDVKSKLPTFSDMVFSTDTMHVGQTIQAIAVQSSKGKLLDRTTYTWSLSDSTYYSNTVIYDNNNENPSSYFIPKEAGKYTLKLVAKYNVSGQASNASGSQAIDNGSIVYGMDPLSGIVTMTKTITVKN